MVVPAFPKSINLSIAGMDKVSLAFMGNGGVQGQWQASHVPTANLGVQVHTYPLGTVPGAPNVTVVEITAKEAFHRVGFQLIHTANPQETVAVTVESLLVSNA